MTVLNYKNSHFNLIINKKHALFEVGSLKFQKEKSDQNKNLLETLFGNNTKVNKDTKADNQVKQTISNKIEEVQEVTPPLLDEHIHCFREEEDCLDKKCDTRINELKKEIEKYKHALREEVEKRTKAEDMLKAMQSVNQIEHKEKETNLGSHKSLGKNPTNKEEFCEQCEFTCSTIKDLE